MNLFKYGLLIILSLLIPTLSQAFSAYSTKELDQLEKEFVQQINQANNVIRIPLATQYINHLGKQLARHGQMTDPYFFLVNANEINAFAGPGGHIGVNSELILTTANESELAAVMAHEMAHVRQHHLYRMIEHQKQMRIPMIASVLAAAALGAIDPALASGALMASLTGIAQDNISFVRSNEKEADRIGIDMLIKGGFDPRAMANFFKKMQQSSRLYYTANIPAILRTHPLDEDRIAEAENRSALLAKKNVVDSLDYQFFKELIRNSINAEANQLVDYYEHQCRKHNTEIACQYGHVLALLSMNQPNKASLNLTPLLEANPDNLYLMIAMSDVERAQKAYTNAEKRLSDVYANYPDNYAVILSYGQSLIDAQKPAKAAEVLLKGSRLFKTDLILCVQLARAESANHRNDYAYFTNAQCALLQGLPREAMRQLKMAKSLVSQDRYLKARIDAKIEEVIFLSEK